MKRIDAYQTADGKIHPTRRDADRHAENLYGDLVTKLARELCQITKYTDTVDYIEAHTSEFRALIKLKDDTFLEPEHPEECEE